MNSMVLDRPKESPFGNKNSVKKGTPNARSPKASQITPVKGAPKRPLENSDEDSEENELGTPVNQSLLNGLSKNKKPRLSLPQNVVPHESDDDEDEDEDDDDDDQDEDTDDDEGEEDEGDDDDEDDDDDDDDDDESDNDEDDDDEDDDESESKEAGESHQVIAKVGKPKTVIPKASGVTLSSVKDLEQKQKNKQQSQIEPMSAASSEIPSSSTYFLIPHPPRNFDDVKKVLATRSITVSDIRMLHSPVAIATVDSKAGTPSAALNKPLSINGNTLHLIELNGSSEALQAIRGDVASKTLFATGIPKSVSIDSLKAKLPVDCRDCSIHLLASGPKNKVFNAAFLNFASVALASKAMQALAHAQFENRTLRVTYGRDKPGSQEAPNLRGSTRTLIAEKLPVGVTEDQLKSIFTTASSFRIARRKQDTMCYIEFDSNEAASAAFDTHNGGQIGKSTLNLRFAQTSDFNKSITVEVSQVPKGIDHKRIVSLFPGAISATQLSEDYFSVSFPSLEARRNALKGKKVIDGTKLKVSMVGGLDRNIGLAKNIPFDSTEQDVKSLFPNATSVSLNLRNNGKPNGTATVIFPTSELCQEAASISYTLKGRNVSLFMKRVDLEETAVTQHTQAKPVPQKPASKPKESELPQVGSESEDEDEDDDDGDSDADEDEDEADEDEGSDEDDDDEENEEDDDEVKDTKNVVKKVAKQSITSKPTKTSNDESDDDDENDAEDESDEDDDDDEDEDDDDDDEQESVDEGIDEDEEMPMVKQEKTFEKKQNFQSPKFDNKRGFNNRGRGSFGDRGRGGNFGRGSGYRGGGRGGERGGHDHRGFKHGGGGHRGHGGGSEGFRGRGRFNNRGRGNHGRGRN